MLLTDRESLVEKPRPNPKLTALIVSITVLAVFLAGFHICPGSGIGGEYL